MIHFLYLLLQSFLNRDIEMPTMKKNDDMVDLIHVLILDLKRSFMSWYFIWNAFETFEN